MKKKRKTNKQQHRNEWLDKSNPICPCVFFSIMNVNESNDNNETREQ